MMSELKRVTSPVANTMTVIEKGDDISRPGSTASVSRKPLKKTSSEGLLSLSPEPGHVKFETPPRPSSGGSRCGSAGRVEKKLPVLKKKDDGQVETRNINSADGTISRTSQPDNATVSANPKPKPALEEKPNKKLESDAESSDDSETDSDESDSESEEKPMAPIEMKGEFLKCVMDEDYTKAKELCQKILLLEPDNSVCIEFHGVIVQKLEQEKEAEEIKSDSDDDSDDDSDEDSDDEEEDDENDDDDDDSSSDEESESDDDDDFTPPPGLNLIMGGLPIKPQPKNE